MGIERVDDVIHIEEVDPYIILIKMQDKKNKNTFSEEMLVGLRRAFEMIKSNLRYKVVVLTGYDNYFSCGGTKQALLDIQEGKATFLAPDGESNIYSLPLQCDIPVIAAMQGHAIGGGLALGLFADFIIMSRESIYSASFMKYGFTPGFGATCIFPEKLGIYLAEELLLGAKTYHGVELQERGIASPVIPRKDILDYSLDLAKSIAEKPRNSLVVLKNHLVEELRKKLPQYIDKEIIMHEQTFHQAEVKEKINSLYSN